MKQRCPLKLGRPRRKPPPFNRPPASEKLHKRPDELLDEALEETFPASDAFALNVLEAGLQGCIQSNLDKDKQRPRKQRHRLQQHGPSKDVVTER
jgi:hypothetical protein